MLNDKPDIKKKNTQILFHFHEGLIVSSVGRESGVAVTRHLRMSVEGWGGLGWDPVYFHLRATFPTLVKIIIFESHMLPGQSDGPCASHPPVSASWGTDSETWTTTSGGASYLSGRWEAFRNGRRWRLHSNELNASFQNSLTVQSKTGASRRIYSEFQAISKDPVTKTANRNSKTVVGAMHRGKATRYLAWKPSCLPRTQATEEKGLLKVVLWST